MHGKELFGERVCLVLALIIAVAMSAAGSDLSSQLRSNKAQLDSLVLAAKLLEQQLAQVVTRLELVSEQYVLPENQHPGEGSIDWLGSDLLTSEFVQLVLWVNDKGGVFQTYPESALSSETRFVGPEIFRLIKRSVRNKAAVASSIVNIGDSTSGFWVTFPVFKDGSPIYSVVASINLDAIQRMVPLSLRQKIFVLDDGGHTSLALERLQGVLGWDASLVLGGDTVSVAPSPTDLVAAGMPGVLRLTQPPLAAANEQRAVRLIIAPLKFLDRKCALCSLRPIAGSPEQSSAKEYPASLPVVLSVAAAGIVLLLLLLGLGAWRSRMRAAPRQELSEAAPAGDSGIWAKTFDAVPSAMFVADSNARVVAANRAMYSLLGKMAPASLSGESADAIFGDESTGKMRAFFEAVQAAGSARTNVLPTSSQDEIIELELDGHLLTSDGVKNILVICRSKGTSVQTGSEVATPSALDSESYLDVILNGLNEAVMVVDANYRIKRANKQFLKLVGDDRQESVLGQLCYEVLRGREEPCSTEGISCPVRDVLEKSRSVGIVHHRELADGADQFLEIFACPIEARGAAPEIMVSLRDITEKTHLSMQLARADKLKALGEMASGVAHDFNNLLGVILGRTQMLIRMIGGQDAGTRRNLEIIERTALDGAETVRRIQGFAKIGDTSAFVPVALGEIIEDSLGITKPRWREQMQVKGVVIETKFVKSRVPRVAGKPSELREVFVNLINNAIDAMPEGGRITIETGTDEGNVYALVRDNGEGIPVKIMDKVFDPFFTTREPTNSGLGLSIVLGIVERHGGSITVNSKLGEWTEFRIEIPALLGDFREAEQPQKEAPRPRPAHKKARVLVIDDEADIRNLLVDMLAGEGHEVEIASSGEEGIKKCERVEYDYVITDLGMPRMSGWDVAKRVKALRPDARVILATGWGVHFDEEKLKSAGVERIITKPFQVDEVLNCINGHH